MGTSWIVGTRNESTSTGGNYGANAEANADCAINRFPSMFVSSFVTLIGFDWLKAFIRYFFTFTGLTNLVRKVMRGGPLPLHKLSGRILQHDRLHHGRHPARPDWASGHQRSDRRAYNIEQRLGAHVTSHQRCRRAWQPDQWRGTPVKIPVAIKLLREWPCPTPTGKSWTKPTWWPAALSNLLPRLAIRMTSRIVKMVTQFCHWVCLLEYVDTTSHAVAWVWLIEDTKIGGNNLKLLLTKLLNKILFFVFIDNGELSSG